MLMDLYVLTSQKESVQVSQKTRTAKDRNNRIAAMPKLEIRPCTATSELC
ncbi:MAG TPA: hypothetical protein VLU95_02900 [Candidatus Acidoferrum sp.]|nr:hypothetical protein [Candidatus Acidoferrum sp.]